jgi:hypothetical protein
VESGKATAHGWAHSLVLLRPHGVDAWSDTSRWAAAGGVRGAAAELPRSRGLGLGDGRQMSQAMLRVGESCWAATQATCRGGMEGQAGPAGWVEFGPWPIENWKKHFNFQIFSKSRTNLNSNQFYNFDDFHSHRKL